MFRLRQERFSRKHSALYVFSVLALVVLTAGCKERPPEFKYVTSENGINARREPSMKALKISVIGYGEKVQVLETRGPRVTIANAEGRWARVKVGAVEGWVFDAFLSTLKPPARKQGGPKDDGSAQLKLTGVQPTEAEKPFALPGGPFSLGEGCSGSTFSEFGVELSFKENGALEESSFSAESNTTRRGKYTVTGKTVTVRFTEEITETDPSVFGGEGKKTTERKNIDVAAEYHMKDCRGAPTLVLADGKANFTRH